MLSSCRFNREIRVLYSQPGTNEITSGGKLGNMLID